MEKHLKLIFLQMKKMFSLGHRNQQGLFITDEKKRYFLQNMVRKVAMN